MLDLDLLSLQQSLKLSKTDDKPFVFDPIRKKDVALTPEELVRQLFLVYLLNVKKYPANRIRVEIGITVNGLPKRCDVVVFDAEVQPWLLVECKSPKVPIVEAVFEQAARYNLKLRAPFMVATNGAVSYCAALDFENSTFAYCPELPEYPEKQTI